MAQKVGAPSKFTKEKADKIIEYVRKGNFKTTAARASGINVITLNRWVEAGRNGKSKELREFCIALDKAEADAETAAVERWIGHQDKSPEAIKEYLRRRFSQWNVTEKHDVKQEVTEETNVIDKRIDNYFAELKKRSIKKTD